MNLDVCQKYFGVVSCGNKKIITSGFNDIQDIMQVNELCGYLRVQSKKKLSLQTDAEIFKCYFGLLKLFNKKEHFKTEYPFASISPYVEQLLKAFDSFIYSKPFGKILSIKKLDSKIKHYSLAFINNYRFDKVHLIDEPFHRHIRPELQSAFKQFILKLRTDLGSPNFNRMLRAKQQAVGKSSAAMKKFLESSFSKHESISVISLVVYGNSARRIYENNFPLESFYIDDEHAKQEMEIEKKAEKKMIEELKILCKESVSNPYAKQSLIFSKARREKKVRLANRKEKYIENACELRNRFIQRIREIFKEVLIGYIWKLEYTSSCGLYFRLYLLYKPSVRISSKAVAHELGLLWINDITKGVGCFENDHISRVGSFGLESIDKTMDLCTLKENVCFLAKSNYFIDNTFTGRKTLVKTTP